MKKINFLMKMGSFFSKIPYFLLKIFNNREIAIAGGRGGGSSSSSSAGRSYDAYGGAVGHGKILIRYNIHIESFLIFSPSLK